MTALPEKFKERMKEQLGESYDDFLAGYEKQGYSGIRVNTTRLSVREARKRLPFLEEQVPWTENGFYCKTTEYVTKHPYYYAGLYYIQEPSAMLPAAALPVQPGDKVLDLCAAPGGKATELASKLQGTGLLVANDASASRAKALVKNLSMWGCANCCITAETPEKLLEHFGCYFDKILVDAPCSGEGMFRRDPSLMTSWETRGPSDYAPLQKKILDCAVQMLTPGGMLAYSTCTFSREEDEAVVEEILERYPDLKLLPPKEFLNHPSDVTSVITGNEQTAVSDPLPWGFLSGADSVSESLRLWPHLVRGEGHFLALIQKTAPPAGMYAKRDDPFLNLEKGEYGEKLTKESSTKKSSTKNDALLQMPQEIRDFAKKLPERLLNGTRFRIIGEQCLLLPGQFQLPEKLRYLRTGLLLGSWKRGRFEPSQSLAMTLNAQEWPAVLDLPSGDDRVLRYLKGETISLPREGTLLEKGWVLICTDGFALGWGKLSNDTVKNKYYPGWRMQ